MKKAKFLTFLTSKGYSFIEEGDGISINNQGSVDLSSLTTLPDGIQFNNQGSVDLRSLTTLPDGIQFNNQGYVDLRSLTTLPDGIQFNNQGYVDLSSLTTLPDGIQFNNQGSVYLRSLTTLPDGIQFNNQGSVDLSSLKNFDEIKAGNEERNLFVVYGPKYGLRISLGCFIGSEDEAINAIKKKYKGKDAPVYIHKVTSAFTKAKERYAKLLVNHSTNI